MSFLCGPKKVLFNSIVFMSFGRGFKNESKSNHYRSKRQSGQKELAKKYQKEMTPEERSLWCYLCNSTIGLSS